MLRRGDDRTLRVALDWEVSGKRNQEQPKDLEEASERDRKDWFKGGYPESSKVERWSASDYRKNGVNPIISTKVTILNYYYYYYW